ncbi:MAG: tetratricopeptide repeat protein [Deltaproteobacteria bacterium]|nr:tetratricopeptide repeat protein [Candidatus Deferrimicrobiaceae bacterium]
MNDAELGFLAMRNGDHQEALNLFRRCLERGDPAAYRGLALASYHLEEYPVSRWAFHKYLEIRPGDEESLRHLDAIGRLARRSPPARRESRFRVGRGCLEILQGSWRRAFLKGINLGLGVPGHFPGEYAIGKGTYRKWFGMIARTGFNAVRTYAIHPPGFYEALRDVNDSGIPLYLLQGVWLEPPGRDGFDAPGYLAYANTQVEIAVDAVCGNLSLPERPGYPHGRYECDVSSTVCAFLVGREWEPCAVRAYNEARRGDAASFEGEFLSMPKGRPFEAWVARLCDHLLTVESERYGITHPISALNWPTLDPLDHPSESNHEDELRLQGISIRPGICNENEDMESLDVARILSRKGAGHFATYHAYPYYPDFMNNDYLSEEHPYLAYLALLRRHHGDQPVLIGEVGVPGSREIAHWNRKGWHHGGHDSLEQAKINSLLVKEIHEAGMAGAVLFSWFDEWFKKNWLFQPYYDPPDRKPFWFNIQDAEENYGMLAAWPGYPGPKVRLAGRMEDWADADTLYEEKNPAPAHRFRDGGDDARTLRRLSVQHDEGFLYVLVETKGDVDFAKANYLVGLGTCPVGEGERLLPFRTDFESPVGITFLVHLAGKAKSRILVCQGYDKYLNAHGGRVVPAPSSQGSWVMMQNRTNARRIGKDGKRFFPSRVFSMSRLRFGSLDEESPIYNSIADFHAAGNRVELRLPWSLLNFTDPSSRTVLWRDGAEKGRTIPGVRMFALSYKPEKQGPAALPTGGRVNITDSLPEKMSTDAVGMYEWKGWDTPVFHTFLKPGHRLVAEALSAIPEAR